MTIPAALVVLAGMLLGPTQSTDQASATDSGRVPQPGGQLTVRLVTAGPGLEVWNRFGHNGLWIHDSLAGTDRFYDYGNFDFAEPGFMVKFVRGQMRYWMGVADAHRVLRFYAGRNRTITVQELALSSDEKLQLQQFLERNLLPENRYYDYDYYYDNCSTRVRDAIDLVVGGAVARQLADTVAGASLRLHTDRLLAPDIWAYTGTKFGLGPGTDRPASRWAETFIPMKLMEYLRTVRVPDDSGGTTPLVRSEERVYLSTLQPPPAAGPHRTPRYLLLGASVAVMLLWLGLRADGSKAARWGLLGAGGVISLVAGLAGSLLAFLWCCTEHTITMWNTSLFQANPLMLASVPLLLAAPRSVALRRWLGLLAALSLSGVAVSLLMGQANLEIVALMVPIHLALWRAVTIRGTASAAVKQEA